ncbi:type 2 periplasmic-binding domain-containing protein [Teredinibacter purpureus]|uniref:transporter substrate-binding domain-containing protein n=1 Tax=Teredinibacter purpureus TaxID=2731756 RepID=UPI00069843E2|nr:transporter substrate-binding domain-containing protein [Teredinibacter purpureus]
MSIHHSTVLKLPTLNRLSGLVRIATCLLSLLAYTSLASAPSSGVCKHYRLTHPVIDIRHFQDVDRYFLEMLHLAMEKSGDSFVIIPEKQITLFNEKRSEIHLQLNHYNVHWLNTSQEREANLIPIRIPLFKGLIGWRLMFIRRDDQALFSEVNTALALRSYTAGQGHDWPDNNILQSNELPLITSSNWESLFKMLSKKRIDYFPRSVVEIWRENDGLTDKSLTIDKHLALHYPAAYYFFVNKQHPNLAKAIERGLNSAIKDGSFDELFSRYFDPLIAQAALNTRTIIHLHNPHIAVPNRPELWYQPAFIARH